MGVRGERSWKRVTWDDLIRGNDGAENYWLIYDTRVLHFSKLEVNSRFRVLRFEAGGRAGGWVSDSEWWWRNTGHHLFVECKSWCDMTNSHRHVYQLVLTNFMRNRVWTKTRYKHRSNQLNRPRALCRGSEVIIYYGDTMDDTRCGGGRGAKNKSISRLIHKNWHRNSWNRGNLEIFHLTCATEIDSNECGIVWQ